MKLDLLNINYIKNNWLIFIFSIVVFFYCSFNLANITPHHDQTFHISWLQNLKYSDHFLPKQFFSNLDSLMYDKNGFIHELLKPANNPYDYHAYLFQINSILTVYLFSTFINLDPIKLYIFVSIFFSSLSIIINYKILICIITKYKIYKDSFLYNAIYQFLFCLINLSFYKYYFAPLGHHNIGYFFFSLTILLFLNNFFSQKKYFYYLLGLFVGLVSYFQITIALLLLPSFSIYILFSHFRINLKNIKNFFKFFITSSILFSPFLFLIIKDLLNFNENYFINLIGNENFEIEFYFNKISFWFKNLYVLCSPIIFFGFIISIFISLRLKKFNFLYVLIAVHFVINIILSIFFISYLRNFYYIFNLFMILSAFSFLYVFYQKQLLLKFIAISLLIFNSLYNLQIIFDVKRLQEKNSLFFQLYYEKKGDIKKQISSVKEKTNQNLVFHSDFSKNYFKAYDFEFVKKHSLIDKPLLNISNHIDKKKNYSIKTLNSFEQIKDNFLLISFSSDFNQTKQTIIKLQSKNLINEKCLIITPHLINKNLFRDSVSGKNNVFLFLTKINC